jgi:hypothetical protein
MFLKVDCGKQLVPLLPCWTGTIWALSAPINRRAAEGLPIVGLGIGPSEAEAFWATP